MKVEKFFESRGAVRVQEKGAADFITRWKRVRNRVSANLDRISKSELQGLEPTSRLRAALRKKIGISGSRSWLESVWLAINEDSLTAPESADEMAEEVSKWVESASNKEISSLGQERIIGDNEREPVEFFEKCLIAANSVGRVTVLGEASGTGFFVGESIIVTNNHVLPNEAMASAATIEMNVEDDFVDFGPPKREEEFELSPQRFFYTDKDLDVTFVSTRSKSSGRGTPAKEFGQLPLIEGEGKILIGGNANIIQHPGGANKVVAFRNGVLVELKNNVVNDAFCYYSSDTDEGSSGAPVFNDLWQVIAVHHRALPKLDKNGNILDRRGKRISEEAAEKNPGLVAWEANEGTRVSRIVAGLRSAALPVEMGKIRKKLLKLWED